MGRGGPGQHPGPEPVIAVAAGVRRARPNRDTGVRDSFPHPAGMRGGCRGERVSVPNTPSIDPPAVARCPPARPRLRLTGVTGPAEPRTEQRSAAALGLQRRCGFGQRRALAGGERLQRWRPQHRDSSVDSSEATLGKWSTAGARGRASTGCQGLLRPEQPPPAPPEDRLEEERRVPRKKVFVGHGDNGRKSIKTK